MAVSALLFMCIVNVCMYGWMDAWMYGCCHMDIWIYGSMDLRMYGWMDGWIHFGSSSQSPPALSRLALRMAPAGACDVR
eukprot:405663-Heterocapsa_arctica.AAC.1